MQPKGGRQIRGGAGAQRPQIEIAPDGELSVLVSASPLERWSWALYDFANTIFSMNITTLYFPVWIITERGASNTAYSLSTSLSSLVVLFAAPYFGALSDVSRRRKPWVVAFTLACVGMTVALAPLERLPFPREVSVFLLLAAYAVAHTAYQMALPFYNAMMPELVPEQEQGRLSGYGTAAGYVGSIVGVLLVAPFVLGGLRLLPPGGREAAFLPTAFLFLLFSLPLFFFCRDHLPLPPTHRRKVSFRETLGKIVEVFRQTEKYPGLRRFLFASYFYQDALGTAIAFMVIYAVAVLGLERGAEIRIFVTLTLPAVVGSFFAGKASDRFGPRRTLLAVLWGWVGGLAILALAPSLTAFWIGGFLIGLVFGGIWAAERPLLLTLVPDSEGGRFFGLLVLSTRAAAIVGPLLMGLLADRLAPPLGKQVAYRVAVASLALFMLAAILLLRGVPERRIVSRVRRA